MGGSDSRCTHSKTRGWPEITTGRKWSVRRAALRRRKKKHHTKTRDDIDKIDQSRLIPVAASKTAAITKSSSPSSSSSSSKSEEQNVTAIPRESNIAAPSNTLASLASLNSNHETRDVAQVLVEQANQNSKSNSSFPSVCIKEDKRELVPFITGELQEDGKAASALPSPVDHHTREVYMPMVVAQGNSSQFIKGIVMTISSLSHGLLEVSVYQDSSGSLEGSEYTVQLPTERSCPSSLITALTDAFSQCPNITISRLLLELALSMDGRGELHHRQLTGHSDTYLRDIRAAFFDAPMFISRTRALFVGISSYTQPSLGHPTAIEDLRNLRRFLSSHGWSTDTSSLRVLTDDPNFSNCSPSYMNILKQLRWLANGVTDDDALLFVFAGARAIVGKESALLPQNFSASHLITDSMIYKVLVTSLPVGANMTMIFDCHNGGVQSPTFRAVLR